MDKKQVVVIIPFYKGNLSASELVALQQCVNMLSDFPLIAIKPQELTLPREVSQLGITKSVSFDDHFFASISGYNALMLSDVFYKTFLDYEFMLIHQLDAFIFKNELSYWCNKGFDYIGAPWLREFPYIDFIKGIKSQILQKTHIRTNKLKDGLPSPLQFENRVGNGGLSLRRTKKFYDIALNMQPRMHDYLNRTEHQYNEDAFWSIEVNRKNKVLKIPSLKTGLKFSMELFPERAFQLNHNELPFGCHAWDKYPDFWRPVFNDYGYNI
ncbi:DUF5672 family protein [Mucilaginibacter glaciei]|uniref:DUF5672 domain-containing protein n=1 Tax=Mucilaginibacter glaciei TaxID=2772109 RepID=A0A926NW97_9SPHI|nr:DUF5672 family protein [Mucilaginibacter glaciei]MBD1392884.1 hypothetical protein [Mucilaginibacter glaciei]